MTSTSDFDYSQHTVTPEDIARGWQLWEVRTNADISYTMPEGAVLASNWWVRGAYEDCSIVRLGDCSIGGGVNQSNNPNNPNNRTMSFPFGTNEYLWAKAGETYRVKLLIGKTYDVESTQPVDVVGRSSSSIEIDGNGSDELTVVWPVTITALEGNGSSFLMRVVPSELGGIFNWTQHCCTITGYGNQFWWAHERYCYCGGCYAYGFYSYEGYEKACTGGHCGCPYYDGDDPSESEEDDGPYAAGASVEFSESVVIFEDAYTNMPGEVVARQSTRTTLTCIAHGGETGGTATFSIENGAKLVSCSGGSLPVTRFVPPLQKVEFEIVYECKLPSDSEDDIVAKADFTERVTGTRHSTAEDIHYRSYPASVNVTWTFPEAFIDIMGIMMTEARVVTGPIRRMMVLEVGTW